MRARLLSIVLMVMLAMCTMAQDQKQAYQSVQ